MWKITTRGLTLQEVLILVAMNIATAAIPSERNAGFCTESLMVLGLR